MTSFNTKQLKWSYILTNISVAWHYCNRKKHFPNRTSLTVNKVKGLIHFESMSVCICKTPRAVNSEDWRRTCRWGQQEKTHSMDCIKWKHFEKRRTFFWAYVPGKQFLFKWISTIFLVKSLKIHRENRQPLLSPVYDFYYLFYYYYVSLIHHFDSRFELWLNTRRSEAKLPVSVF